MSERLRVNIIYQDLGRKSVIVRAPRDIPESALLGLLAGALQTQGFVLAESATEGWLTIVPDSKLTQVAQSVTTNANNASDVPETRVFTTKHLGARRADGLIKAHLSKPGGLSNAYDDLNMVVVTDRGSVIRKIERLLEVTDQPSQGSEIRYISIAHGDAEEIANQADSVVSSLFGEGTEGPSLKLIVDDRTSQIIAIGETALVEEAAETIAKLDTPVPRDRMPVRIYKLAHATAEDVLSTLSDLELENGATDIRFADEADRETIVPGVPHVSADPARADDDLEPKVIADVNTNSIIVVGDLATQRVFASLIEALDKRRPQVVVEITSVLLDTSNGYSVGVELGAQTSGDPRSLIFSAFGLSSRDESGAPTAAPGAGLSGFVISPGEFDVVLRALETSGRARVTTSPRLLVNDNATGRLTSTSQEPFESVNASDTVSTTTFGGYAEAGTTLVLTPHISEIGFVQLEYSITLSTFTGERIGDLPPPRQENTLESIVTLPDGFSIVTGGLTVSNESANDQRVPLLGDIPLLGGLFRSESESRSDLTLFLFIRPAIAKDTTLAGLKKMSATVAASIGHRDDWPESEPMVMMEAAGQ